MLPTDSRMLRETTGYEKQDQFSWQYPFGAVFIDIVKYFTLFQGRYRHVLLYQSLFLLELRNWIQKSAKIGVLEEQMLFSAAPNDGVIWSSEQFQFWH